MLARYMGTRSIPKRRMLGVKDNILPMILDAVAFLPPLSWQYNGQYDDGEYNGEYNQQTASLSSRALLIPIRTPQFQIRMPRIRSHVLHIACDRIQLSTLLMYNMRYISEQLIQLSNTLLNIPYLRLSFYYKGVLEVDFILRC